MTARDELFAVSADDVFTRLEAGEDDALRQVMRQWRIHEPDLGPSSFAPEIERWRAFHAERISAGGVARLYRVFAVRPDHWKVPRGMAAVVGRHWSLREEQTYVMAGGMPQGAAEYLLTAEIPADAAGVVDWAATLAANVAFGDQEHEVVLRAGIPLKLAGIRDLADGKAVRVPPAATAPAPPDKTHVPFSPRLTTERGTMYYEDGRVHGMVQEYEVEGCRRGISILEWNSDDPGRGHTLAALAWLRARYDVIAASGIGEIDEDGVRDISVNYWERMREKGLVDVLVLDDGTELPPPEGPKP